MYYFENDLKHKFSNKEKNKLNVGIIVWTHKEQLICSKFSCWKVWLLNWTWIQMSTVRWLYLELPNTFSSTWPNHISQTCMHTHNVTHWATVLNVKKWIILFPSQAKKDKKIITPQFCNLSKLWWFHNFPFHSKN